MIKVLRMGQAPRDVHREDARTVGDLLGRIGMAVGSTEEVRLNGNTVSMETPLLNDNATLTVVPAVKGGR